MNSKTIYVKQYKCNVKNYDSNSNFKKKFRLEYATKNKVNFHSHRIN